MRLSRGVLGWLLLASTVWLTACNRPEPVHKQQSFVFGTQVEVTVYGVEEGAAHQALQTVLGEFDRLHRAWHPWESGPLETINAALAAGRSAPIDAELATAIAGARDLAIASDHLFNPAIGNLVRLWGFHTDTFVARLPDAAEQTRLTRAQPRLTDLVIAKGQIRSSNPAVRIDLGGYAKGYALDLAARKLREAGIRNALVNIGGNVMALGQRGDRPWHIAIQHPRRPGILAELDLHDGEAIGTSGDYQRFFERDGRRYCHLLDPRSGAPVTHTQALTVLTAGPQAGTRSDALSKPLFVAGPQDWQAMARKTGITLALRVDDQGRVTVTTALAARLTFAPDSPPSPSKP
jgi:thiamine biosynthesis lipoprotein